MAKYPDRQFATTYEKLLKITGEREKARYSTWYEMFPRSCGSPDQHGTFSDCIARLPYIAEMGFDVLYLPPIHPIGITYRKGKNNTTVTEPGDVGVPWGIGAAEGGHKAIHPQLGTLEDFRELVAKAQDYGIEIALDIAYQCSPDHPYVREHPQWFKHRPDGTIQYAENPPKKYQDIYPIDFETEDWKNLWEELKSVVLFWIEQGVHIFRVDNPHTKAFPFWEWMIGEVKQAYPETIFLSESFTRPKVMYRLAKVGYTQSYTYFTWRNTKWELQEYFTELTQTEVREFFRPNVWPNTPDILHEFLQHGGQPAFKLRLALAATLAASYGIYGPAYEVCENRPIKAGSEEYLDSEKYQMRVWDLDSPYTIKDWIQRANRSRREHPALQSNNSLRFHEINNEEIICYTKQSEDLSDLMLMVVNLSPYHTHSGWLHLPLESLGLKPDQPYQLHDLLNDAHYTWSGEYNYVELNPHASPAHIFWIEQ
jgi:starch synthase (maltosyl-transferring)